MCFRVEPSRVQAQTAAAMSAKRWVGKGMGACLRHGATDFLAKPFQPTADCRVALIPILELCKIRKGS